MFSIISTESFSRKHHLIVSMDRRNGYSKQNHSLSFMRRNRKNIVMQWKDENILKEVTT